MYQERAKAAKAVAADAKHDKKRSASASPREEVIRTNVKSFFESPGEEGEEKEDRLITNDLDGVRGSSSRSYSCGRAAEKQLLLFSSQ
ncbi:hypothetical protein PC119_g20939 [Phytophthora cactorum]|nr:hypothetical protein PC119_g20939 [Phytophthora cactorum]